MLRLIPAYTLETLDKCDIDRLIPYYLWDYRKSLSAKLKAEAESGKSESDEIVYRDGKAFKKTNAKKCEMGK